jgi:hypothetical protein
MHAQNAVPAQPCPGCTGGQNGGQGASAGNSAGGQHGDGQVIEDGRQQRQGSDGGLSMPTCLGAAGDHDVASGLDCARSGRKITDLGGRGDTRVVRAPNPRKVLTETDRQQRRFGGDRRGEQLGLARGHPRH